MYGRKHQQGVNWVTTIAMTAFHVGAVAAFFVVDYGAMLTALLLYVVAGMLGIGMGYHRLLTHRAYKTHKGIEVLPDVVRHAGARGRTHLLGRHASHSSPEGRLRGRSSHTARGHMVGSHGLDHRWRGHAP